MKKIGTGSPKAKQTEPKLRLLYVEDDDDNWRVAQLRLSKSFNLVLARTDREACEIVLSEGSTLGAILMDIELRGSLLNGIELTRLFRGTLEPAKCPPYAKAIVPLQVPIVFMTAYGARFSEAELSKAGASRVIHKPVDFLALNIALTRLHLEKIFPTI